MPIENIGRLNIYILSYVMLPALIKVYCGRVDVRGSCYVAMSTASAV